MGACPGAAAWPSAERGRGGLGAGLPPPELELADPGRRRADAEDTAPPPTAEAAVWAVGPGTVTDLVEAADTPESVLQGGRMKGDDVRDGKLRALKALRWQLKLVNTS